MNQAVRDQRLTYLALTNEGDMLLCDVCRFAEARGSICEGNCYTVCKHKLADYLEPRGYFGMEPGQDCWAFRPSKSIEVVADLVGLMLATPGLEGWQEQEDGTLIVYSEAK